MARTDENDYTEYVVQRNSDVSWSEVEKVLLVSLGLCKQIAITTLCRVNNVSPPLFYKWKKLFVARGLEERINTLERYLEKLILEKPKNK